MSVRWITGMDLTNPASLDADSAALAASWILYKLTAEKYPGISTSTDWYGTDRSRFFVPVRDRFSAANKVTIYEVENDTSRELRLRSRPIVSVDHVETPAGVVDPSRYALANGAYLVPSDSLTWDFTGGVSVTYTHGVLPPEPGIRAAQRLADELVKAVEDPANCVLPDRVTSISRQGVSYTILDPQDFIENGRTGMYEVDLFIKAANPINARKKPKVYSPDIPSGRRYK